jgi:hypothetical protein
MSCVNYVARPTRRSGGSRSSFFLVKGRNRIGFKTFGSRDHALFAYTLQKTFCELDMAPRVYGDVGKIRHSSGELSKFGYLTELAKLDYNFYEEHYYDAVMALNNHPILVSNGLNHTDGHGGNWGVMIRKGVKCLVCIDWGMEGFSVRLPNMDYSTYLGHTTNLSLAMDVVKNLKT